MKRAASLASTFKHMFFALLTFVSAFLIEGLGTWISIIGLSSLFRADPIIIALAAALDVGKLVTVSFLYKEWNSAPRMLRFYMLLATAVLMVITSAGAFGYLSGAFQGAIQDTKQQEILVAAAVQEKAKLEARKKEIDAQIANLPANIVRGRQRLIAAFRAEADRINARISELDAELPKMQVHQVSLHTHAGPIVYVSQAFGVSVEQAVKYVIMIIIFVFDPLAIALLVAGNFLWEKRRRGVQAASLPSVEPSACADAPQEETVPDGEAPVPAEARYPVGVAASGPQRAVQAAHACAKAEREPAQGDATAVVAEYPAGHSDAVVHAVAVDAKEAGASGEDRARAGDSEHAIREAAYYLAESRDFKDGTPADDWIQAEQQLGKSWRTAG